MKKKDLKRKLKALKQQLKGGVTALRKQLEINRNLRNHSAQLAVRLVGSDEHQSEIKELQA